MTDDWWDDEDPPELPPLPSSNSGHQAILDDPSLVAWVVERLRPQWWFPAAACRGSSVFFRSNPGPAIAICEECPVTLACREWTLSRPIPSDGVWGGMTVKELRAERRRRRLAQPA